MAAKPLSKIIVEKIIADHRTGVFSRQALADKYGVSKGAVVKLCKGVEQDMTAIVTAGVQYQQGLAGHDDRMVTAVENAVTSKLGYIRLFNELASDNALRASRLPCETQQDHERLSNTILRSKEVVLGKSPDTAIQINQGESPQVVTYALPSNGRD